jgi:hypothetical protein
MKTKPRGLCSRSLYTSVALALALGCARKPAEPEPASSRVQPYGEKFIVSYSSLWGTGEALNSCVRDANAYCEGRGLRMFPDSQEPTESTTRRLAGVVLVFRCLAADDPGPKQR